MLNAKIKIINVITESIIEMKKLKTLRELTINTFSFLSKKIPDGIIKICESGINTNRELKKFSLNLMRVQMLF